MNRTDAAMVTTMIGLVAVLAGGFLWHRSPQFAGSAVGGAFAVIGASLMLLGSIVYTVFRRIAPARRALNRRLSMPTLLTWHVYLGIGGAVLALVHTGHKFQSVLGMALTTVMLLVVLSGYVGRYFLNYVGEDALERMALLTRMRRRFDARMPPFAAAERIPPTEQTDLAVRAVEAIAELEYAVATQGRVRVFFRRWAVLHIGLSTMLLGLLALHVWSGIEFGLRWFR